MAVLDKESLESNGITFSRDIKGHKRIGRILGSQAEILSEGLLDFHKFAPQQEERTQMELLRAESGRIFRSLDPTIETYARITKKREARERKALLTNAARANEAAMDIAAEIEDRWLDLLKTKLFNGMLDRARQDEGISSNTAKHAIQSVRVESEKSCWRVSRDALENTVPSDAPRLKYAKPDLYISLPIVDDSRDFKGFQRSNNVRNFGKENLEWLESNRDVISNPVVSLSRNVLMKKKHLLCFPCVVVEVERHDASDRAIQNCYCQAVNGAANALALLNSLSTGIIALGSVEEIQPVVAFTFIGHMVRVWIAGITSRVEGSDGLLVKYHMQCIWKGNMFHASSVIELCCIIDNLERWMIDHFRPWVSGCLDSHRYLNDLYSEISENTSTTSGTESSSDDESEESESEENEHEENEHEENEREENEREENEREENEREENEREENEREENDADDRIMNEEEGDANYWREYPLDSGYDSEPRGYSGDDRTEYEREMERTDSLLAELSLNNTRNTASNRLANIHL